MVIKQELKQFFAPQNELRGLPVRVYNTLAIGLGWCLKNTFMKDKIRPMADEQGEVKGISRRDFLTLVTTAGGAAALVTACGPQIMNGSETPGVIASTPKETFVSPTATQNIEAVGSATPQPENLNRVAYLDTETEGILQVEKEFDTWAAQNGLNVSQREGFGFLVTNYETQPGEPNTLFPFVLAGNSPYIWLGEGKFSPLSEHKEQQGESTIQAWQYDGYDMFQVKSTNGKVNGVTFFLPTGDPIPVVDPDGKLNVLARPVNQMPEGLTPEQQGLWKSAPDLSSQGLYKEFMAGSFSGTLSYKDAQGNVVSVYDLEKNKVFNSTLVSENVLFINEGSSKVSPNPDNKRFNEREVVQEMDKIIKYFKTQLCAYSLGMSLPTGNLDRAIDSEVSKIMEEQSCNVNLKADLGVVAQTLIINSATPIIYRNVSSPTENMTIIKGNYPLDGSAMERGVSIKQNETGVVEMVHYESTTSKSYSIFIF
jgi:hypothetical protein